MENFQWETRLAEIREAGAITGIIEFADPDSTLITDEETVRLEPLLKLAARASERLAYGMLKGVLKYKTESRSAFAWLEFGIDDACDVVNYMHLIEAALVYEDAQGA